MRDMRGGICPLCAHQEIIEAVPAEFANESFEVTAAVTYESRWVLSGRNPKHPHGVLRIFVCRSCGYVQTFALDPETVPIDPNMRTRLIRGPGADNQTGQRRRLQTNHATLYLVDGGIDQDWPNGTVHKIRWGKPFTVHLHRGPAVGWRGPVADVHMRLQQERDDELATVAFTLCLTDSPEIRSLPALTAFLPRIEGKDGVQVLRQIREAVLLHGERLPL